MYFLKDLASKALFCCLLTKRCKVDFMGVVNWSLGVQFSKQITPLAVTVHLNQYGFAFNLVESFSLSNRSQTPTATPYHLGVPIDSGTLSSEDNNSPALNCWKEAYQSLIGSIGWLAHSTHPDLITVHSFFASYSTFRLDKSVPTTTLVPFVPWSTRLLRRNSTILTKYNLLSSITIRHPPSSNRAQQYQQHHLTTSG